MSRNIILKTLKDELMEYIQPSVVSASGRKYKTNLRSVLRGVYGASDVVSKPAICFTCYNDAVLNEFDHSGVRYLFIYIYGFDNINTYNNNDTAYDAIHDLVEDLQEFLYNDFTYADDTEIGDFVVYEAGLKFPATFFEAEIKIKYDYTI